MKVLTFCSTSWSFATKYKNCLTKYNLDLHFWTVLGNWSWNLSLIVVQHKLRVLERVMEEIYILELKLFGLTVLALSLRLLFSFLFLTRSISIYWRVRIMPLTDVNQNELVTEALQLPAHQNLKNTNHCNPSILKRRVLKDKGTPMGYYLLYQSYTSSLEPQANLASVW